MSRLLADLDVADTHRCLKDFDVPAVDADDLSVRRHRVEVGVGDSHTGEVHVTEGTQVAVQRNALAGIDVEQHVIGDCLAPRTAEEAVYEGLQAGWTI